MPRSSDVIEQITAAFADVHLGEGISLREAIAIDYGYDRGDARESDELFDWQQIPADDLENYDYAYCFMDPLGLRFHLPAYMCFALLYVNDAALRIVTSAWAVSALKPLLNHQQKLAVRSFLTTLLEYATTWGDVCEIACALRAWNDDELALIELMETNSWDHSLRVIAAKNLYQADRASVLNAMCAGFTKNEWKLVSATFRRIANRAVRRTAVD